MAATLMTDSNSHDILISGGGMTGLACAYAMAKTGRSVALCAPSSARDVRTTALLNDSIDYLKKLNLWEKISDAAYPLKTMRLVDGTNRLFRIQQTDFKASEIDLDAFGYNIRNQDLMEAISDELASQKSVRFYDASLETLDTSEIGEIRAILKTANQDNVQIKTRFVVGADGRNSFVRQHFGAGQQTWTYPQTAIVVDFSHEYSSGFASTEFHTETGPFTIVPQSDKTAGLVWLEKPETAEEIAQLTSTDLAILLEQKMQSYLGKISLSSRTQTFPISGLTARSFGSQKHALIGEAAHVFPPIGAQGFNLGIRDIRALVSVFENYAEEDDRGRQYHLARSQDISLRTAGVDLLNRSLLSDFLPVQIARSAGLFVLNKIAPLRKQTMQMGISPVFRG